MHSMMTNLSATGRINDSPYGFSSIFAESVSIVSSGDELAECCSLKLDVNDIMKSWDLLLNIAREETKQYSNHSSPSIPQIKDEQSFEYCPSANTMVDDQAKPVPLTNNIIHSNTKPEIHKIKLDNKIGKKRRSSSSVSSNSSDMSRNSGTICNIANQKHLKRRRQYKKRKNAAPSNPAQSMMEFHFPVWTFHVE